MSDPSSELTIRQAQQLVDEWVQTQGGYWSSLAIVAQLAEETGEIARLVNHLSGEKPKKANEAEQDLGLELCDLIYAVICLANLHGVDLQASFERVLQKYTTRDRGRFQDRRPVDKNFSG
jgi:Predicted pyrophosphatase